MKIRCSRCTKVREAERDEMLFGWRGEDLFFLDLKHPVWREVAFDGETVLCSGCAALDSRYHQARNHKALHSGASELAQAADFNTQSL